MGSSPFAFQSLKDWAKPVKIGCLKHWMLYTLKNYQNLAKNWVKSAVGHLPIWMAATR